MKLGTITMKKNIPVTQPYLPELEEFIPYLQEIWDNKWLTNNGPFHQKLEKALCEFLGVSYISLFTNATIALVTALQALRVTGEVITTPYSFVATSHSIIWNNLKPVFVDIEPNTFNIDPAKIEAAITPNTTAIMPVHCYGNPCEVEKIQKIADNYGLKVIYDAAHAFNIDYMGESLLNHGDLSILSFHATKVFNTFEGGAIICKDEKTKIRIDKLKNFGFVDEVTVTAPGINGKMSEVNAAFGLLQLKYIDEAISKRSVIDKLYRELLKDTAGLIVPDFDPEATKNHSYFPVRITDEFPISRDSLYGLLKEHGVLSRRYFYPLISNMPIYRGLSSAVKNNLLNANLVSEQIICLPIYSELELDDCREIVKIINSVKK